MLARADFPALLAALQSRTKYGEALPWVQLLTHDLQILKQALGDRMHDMPDPAKDLHSYWQLAKQFPHEWKQLVHMYFCIKDDPECQPKRKIEEVPRDCITQHICHQCGIAFSDRKQLAAHNWAKHRVKSSFREFIGDVSECPVCGVDFRTRARLVKHLSERRVRSKYRTTTCHDVFLRSDPARVPDDSLQKLESRDASQHKQARKAGHTNVLAEMPCKRRRLT